jgi:hypothetical protein
MSKLSFNSKAILASTLIFAGLLFFNHHALDAQTLAVSTATPRAVAQITLTAPTAIMAPPNPATPTRTPIPPQPTRTPQPASPTTHPASPSPTPTNPVTGNWDPAVIASIVGCLGSVTVALITGVFKLASASKE